MFLTSMESNFLSWVTTQNRSAPAPAPVPGYWCRLKTGAGTRFRHRGGAGAGSGAGTGAFCEFVRNCTTVVDTIDVKDPLASISPVYPPPPPHTQPGRLYPIFCASGWQMIFVL